MKLRSVITFTILLAFCGTLPVATFAQSSKSKKETTEEKSNFKDSFQSLFKKKEEAAAPLTDKELKASHKEAKKEVSASRKERKAAEAREEAARARAASLKAARKASSAEQKATRKDSQAAKVRSKTAGKNKKQGFWDKLSRKENAPGNGRY